ncbi:MAG: glutamine synthetase, partial [Actinomycetota bacterium]|nr:glutamine synthetase [Actinomycetota bacterium]
MLDPAELAEAIATGEIDTVLVAFPDLQGRLVGKRVTGSYWRDHMNAGAEPLHMCNYLLAVDSEMNVLPGYAFASWDQGYGDMAAQP